MCLDRPDRLSLTDAATVCESQTDEPIRHDVPWELGNREDGYLIGLDCLIDMLSEAGGRSS